MQRVLQLAPAVIETIVRDAEGEPTDVDPGTGVDVTVTDSAGLEIVVGVATLSGDGVYRYMLTAAETAVLDRYTATWTAAVGGVDQVTTTRFEVVGNMYFTIDEARLFDNAALATYPTEQITAARTQAEQTIEDLCGVAFVPRGRRVALDGSGTVELQLPARRIRRLVTVSIDETAMATAAMRVYPNGMVVAVSAFPYGSRNVGVLFEHGYDEPPARIKHAALMLTRSILVPSNIDDRTLTFSDELGTRTLAVPGGRLGSTGIPEVDAAIAQYAEHRPVTSVTIRTDRPRSTAEV